MSLTGLMHTEVEIRRATKDVGDNGEVELAWQTVATMKCALAPARGNAARDAAGEVVTVDAVAYLPADTDVRPKGPDQTPDRLRIDGRDSVCVFVDRGPRSGAPVRVGIRAVT